jgi:hypothetical protein
MKKYAALILCLGLAWGLAAPASAYQVKIGARIDTDVGYIWRSGTSYPGPLGGFNDSRMPDLTTFYIGMPVTNYFRIDWMSNDKSTGGRIEIGIGAGGPGLGHGGSTIALRYMYGWYKFGRCRLVIGHTDNLLASLAYAPYQWFGLAAIGSFTFNNSAAVVPNAPVVLFIGHGKQYSGRFAQIALYYDRGPWTFMVAVGQPSTNNIINWVDGTNLPTAVTAVPNTTFPRLDLVVKYKGKYIGLAPGFSIYMSEFEPISGARLENDKVLSYLLVLPFRISFGNFRIKGEVAYGRNWVAANYFGAQTAFMSALWWGGLNDPSLTKIEDTYMLSACLGLEYYLGRVSFHLGGGWQRSDNATNDQFVTFRHGQQVKYAFNFAVRYRVNRHFVIAPEISYWFYGWDPTWDVGGGNAVFADLGTAWLLGISFQFRF